MILLINNILNSFYECILIVSRIINADIQLKFRIFNALFNHLKDVKKFIRRSTSSLSAIIIKAYKKALIKLTKYYFKTEDSGEIIYNITNILNPTMKLSLYKD